MRKKTIDEAPLLLYESSTFAGYIAFLISFYAIDERL